MLEIKNIKIYGLDEAIVRSGYPTRFNEPDDFDEINLNDSDFNRAKKLGTVKNGSGHDNFLKGIIVQFDIKYSLYFTKQLQRYHFQDFISSQSTMYTITKRDNIKDYCNKYVDRRIIDIINSLIQDYNFGKEHNWDKEKLYRIYMQIISNLPSGFELWAGLTTNYLQLKTIYFQRRGHKLKEDWGEFIKMIENLPYFKEFIIKKDI